MGTQAAYLVRGKTFENIEDGMYVVAIEPPAYVAHHGSVPPGAVAVVERRRMLEGDLLVERALKRLDASPADRRLVDAIGKQNATAQVGDTIIGVVVRAFRVM